MAIERLSHSADTPPIPRHRTVASYKSELAEHRRTENRLREALMREEALLRQRDELIQRQDLLNEESDHRFLNELQMVVSLLSLQSRASSNPAAASQLATAADRIATIGRIHRHLHYFDGGKTVAYKKFLEDLCRDYSTMLSSEQRPELVIVVEGIDAVLPTTTAIPLGYVVNELITNAAKYGDGQIAVKLEPNPNGGYALTVSNDGSVLPEGFDPTAFKGLGMRIIRSFVERIGGELRIGPGDDNQGARFSVLFS